MLAGLLPLASRLFGGMVGWLLLLCSRASLLGSRPSGGLTERLLLALCSRPFGGLAGLLLLLNCGPPGGRAKMPLPTRGSPLLKPSSPLFLPLPRPAPPGPPWRVPPA